MKGTEVQEAPEMDELRKKGMYCKVTETGTLARTDNVFSLPLIVGKNTPLIMDSL